MKEMKREKRVVWQTADVFSQGEPPLRAEYGSPPEEVLPPPSKVI